MDVWAQDYVDVPGFIEFTVEDEGEHLMGTFQFGTVSGWLHCALRDVAGETFVEWTWQGRNDLDSACGRGWASIVDGELVGHLFIHASDDSAFRAVKQDRPAPRPKRAAKGSAKSRGKLVLPRYH